MRKVKKEIKQLAESPGKNVNRLSSRITPLVRRGKLTKPLPGAKGLGNAPPPEPRREGGCTPRHITADPKPGCKPGIGHGAFCRTIAGSPETGPDKKEDTCVSKAAKLRRLEEKRQRGIVKRGRSRKILIEE